MLQRERIFSGGGTIGFSCFILGVVAAPFLPEPNGKLLPETLLPVAALAERLALTS